MKFFKTLGLVLVIGGVGYGTYYVGENDLLSKIDLDTSVASKKVDSWISSADRFLTSIIGVQTEVDAAVEELQKEEVVENTEVIEEVDPLEVPEVTLTLVETTHGEVTATIDISDPDQTVSNVAIILSSDGNVLESYELDLPTLDGEEFTFSDLYSNSDYVVDVELSYLSSSGNAELGKTETITTAPLEVPSIAFLNVTNYSDGFMIETELVDIDETLEEGSMVILRQGDTILQEVAWIEVGTLFSGLSAGETYDLYLAYSYNLNQPESVEVETLLTSVMTEFTPPTITLGTPAVDGTTVTIPYTVDDPYNTIVDSTISLFLSPITFKGEFVLDVLKTEIVFENLDTGSAFDAYLNVDYKTDATNTETLSDKISFTTN